jgi:glycosyltransferase involved in cell wall biosynthesis
MKISVVTVAFNAVQTIEETLESVASQDHGDIEHIVVDGASTDGTIEVLERNRGGLAKLITEPDRGIYDAMNKGIAASTGQVICFLNADDTYSESTVLAKVAEHMSDETLDAVFGDAEFVKGNDARRVIRRYRSDKFRPARIAWGWMPAHPALFLRRRAFEQAGKFRTDYRIAGDFELVARMFHGDALRYKYIPEVLVRMRTGGASTSGWRSTVLLNREVLRACRENGISTNLLMILSKYPFKAAEFLRGVAR